MMVYNGIDLTNNLLTGVTRGVDSTTIANHALGTTAEGGAYLTIVDPTGFLNGQAIGSTPKAYFVVVDVDYLAQVNTIASLGAEIRSTTYFVVDGRRRSVITRAISACLLSAANRCLISRTFRNMWTRSS